jgi:hypothetical protein
MKQQYLNICCFFLPLVWGLSGQYFNICPSGLSDGILFLVSSFLELFFICGVPYPNLPGWWECLVDTQPP